MDLAGGTVLDEVCDIVFKTRPEVVEVGCLVHPEDTGVGAVEQIQNILPAGSGYEDAAAVKADQSIIND